MATPHGATTLVTRQLTDEEAVAGRQRMAATRASNLRGKQARADRWDLRETGWDTWDMAWRKGPDGVVRYVRV